MPTAINDRIEINPSVMMGKPIICGTRITVELILRQLRQGITKQELLQNYPHLVVDDVDAALDYAADLVKDETVYQLIPDYHGQAVAR